MYKTHEEQLRIILMDYDYFYIVEDDVIFLENGVINELLKIKKDNTLTFINNCKNTWSSRDPSDK